MIEEIKIPVLDNERVKYLKASPDRIFLYDNYLEYTWRGEITIEDEDKIPKAQYWHGRNVVLKKNIGSVHGAYSNTVKQYELNILALSGTELVTTIFASWEAMQEVQEKILQWLLHG